MKHCSQLCMCVLKVCFTKNILYAQKKKYEQNYCALKWIFDIMRYTYKKIIIQIDMFLNYLLLLFDLKNYL